MAETITRVRRNLGEMVMRVQTGDKPIVIYSYGKPVAALVSMDDLRLIWTAEDELRFGPMDLKTGRRVGGQHWREVRAWMSRRFGGRYLTEKEVKDAEEYAKLVKEREKKVDFRAR